MPPLENAGHELFAQYVWQGMNQEDAYVKAGYKHSPANANRLIKNEKIQQRLQEFKERAATQIVLSKSYALEATIENVEKALGRRPVKIGKADEVREVYVYRGDVANRAIQLIGLELGMFVEKREITHLQHLEKLTNAELLKELSIEARKAIEHMPAEDGGDKSE